MLAALIGHPTGRPIGDVRRRKAPGMRPVLASEFLRNLGWNGFKPDRHVQRLLSRWCPEFVAEQDGRVDELCGILGTQAKDVRGFLRFSLAGIGLAPPDWLLSHVDNLVWALGAYVEKKGKESDRDYLDRS